VQEEEEEAKKGTERDIISINLKIY